MQWRIQLPCNMVAVNVCHILYSDYRILWLSPCDYLLENLLDIVTIFPIPKANFSTVALLPCDYLLMNLLDIVTILSSSQGSHNIR